MELSPRSASLRFFTLHFSVMVPSEIVALFAFLLLIRVTVNGPIQNRYSFALLTKFLLKTVSPILRAPLAGLVLLRAKLMRSAALSMLSNLIQTFDERSSGGSKEEYLCINCSGVQFRTLW